MSDVKRYFWDGKYNYAESLNAPIDFPLGVKYVLEKDYQALKQENKTLRKISEDTADQRNRYMAEVYDLEQELKKVKTRCHILIGEKTDIKNKLNESRSTTRILRGNWCKAEKENKQLRKTFEEITGGALTHSALKARAKKAEHELDGACKELDRFKQKLGSAIKVIEFYKSKCGLCFGEGEITVDGELMECGLCKRAREGLSLEVRDNE